VQIAANQAAGLGLGVRAANAISILDDISQDPNMPPYTRVKLWNAVSLLEAIKDKDAAGAASLLSPLISARSLETLTLVDRPRVVHASRTTRTSWPE
jgi:hypothetical protein